MGVYDGTQGASEAVRDGETFTLKVGESARIPDLGVVVRFTEVLEDSRCPTHLNCFWTGRVRAAFVAERGRMTAPFVLEGFVEGTPQGGGPSADVLDFVVELQALAPYPGPEETQAEVEAVLRIEGRR